MHPHSDLGQVSASSDPSPLTRRNFFSDGSSPPPPTGCRAVLRGVSVLAADGHRLSEVGLPSAMRSYRSSGRGGPRRASFVVDCDYEIVPFDTAAKPRLDAGPSPAAVARNSSHLATSSEELRPEFRPSFVVKWFRNDEPVPFYQWIPAIGSRLFHHAYKDFIDEVYKHNDRPMEKFRAVRITRPVRELSGNFSCKLEEPIEDTDASGELKEQTASHNILIYDPPADFEIRLNMSSRQLRCTAWLTGEDVASVQMTMFRQDHDRWEMPLGPRLRLDMAKALVLPSASDSNADLRRETLEARKPVRIEARVPLTSEDVKLLEMDTSRTFTCEIAFSRLRGAVEDRSTWKNDNGSTVNRIFQRSLRLLHESPQPDGGDDEDEMNELPDPAAWSAIGSFAPNFRLAFNAVLFLYIYNVLA
ncbi:hypothetical protein BIW11_10094 [Tropilaelaps mercedesae]|uniref:Ig-like domain-containing protein n=1 Tax=Tropilaelaps mercedesae TaxID=418985 RepID=A0A1V9XH81_9ACAR|nr:hypothetical protein BIW11_10094 [Tropilaelaps mercedesae]